MKKWYAEEYEWQIEVDRISPRRPHRALLPERRRSWETGIPVPTAVQSMRREQGICSKVP